MNVITDWFRKLFDMMGLAPGVLGVLYPYLILLVIILFAFLVDWICRRGLVRVIRKITLRTKVTWDDIVFNEKVLVHFCHILPPIVIYILLPIAFAEHIEAFLFIRKLCMIYIIAASLRFVNIFLGVLFVLSSRF